MRTIYLYRNPTGPKKFKAILPDGRSVRFGQKGYSDYTIHKDPLRMARYIARHGGRPTKYRAPTKVDSVMLLRRSSTKENWGMSGIRTPGFWSRWILWSKPTLRGAVSYMERKVLGKNYKIIIKN